MPLIVQAASFAGRDSKCRVLKRRSDRFPVIIEQCTYATLVRTFLRYSVLTNISFAARALPTEGGEAGRETAQGVELSDRYRSPRLSSAHTIRAFLFAMATAATFGPLCALIRAAQRLYESVFDAHHLSEARAPWISKVRR